MIACLVYVASSLVQVIGRVSAVEACDTKAAEQDLLDQTSRDCGRRSINAQSQKRVVVRAIEIGYTAARPA